MESADFINYFSSLDSTGASSPATSRGSRRARPAAGGQCRHPREGPDRGRQGRPDRRGQVHGEDPYGRPEPEPTTSSPPPSASTGPARRRPRPVARGLGPARPHQAPSPAPGRLTRGAGGHVLSLFDLRRYQRPHGRHGLGRRPRTPSLTKDSRHSCTNRSALPPRVEPVDNGGAPVRDWRGPG